MRHRSTKKTLGRKTSERKALLRDLVTAAVVFEKIETSLGRAKVARPLLEKYITLAKNPTLATRRQMLAFFTTEEPVKKLIEVIGPRFKDRQGGYTRIVKLGHRKGDAAPVALIELV